MIKLSDTELKLIKMCKGHFDGKYQYSRSGNWAITLKPLFKEIYGWSPNEFPRDYRECMFNKLFDTYLKIQADGSGSNQQLKGMFSAAFSRGIVRNQRQSIDRVINELCGLIQCNQVIVDGVYRYKLN